MTSVYDETESESSALKCKDLQGSDVILTIASTDMKEFDEKADDGTEYVKKRIIVAFKETEKTMVLNATNLDSVVAHHGIDRITWAGKTITLYPTTTNFRGDQVPCMRIRPAARGSTVSQGLPTQAPEGNDHPNAPGMEQDGDPGVTGLPQ